MPVVAETLRGFPEAVADIHGLVVLGVLDVFRERQPFGIVGHHGRPILIDQVFETSPIAIERNRAGSGAGSRNQIPGEERHSNKSDCA